MWEQCKVCTHANFIKATWDEPKESECELDREEWWNDEECPRFHEIGDWE